MLDVHPPHHTPNTWRDFFIHIATISVGLLIAVGLEQTIEAIHHRHQRHQLEAQLHDEAQRNLDLVQRNLMLLKVRLDYVNAAIVALNQASVVQGRISSSVMPPRPPSQQGISEPSQTVWAVAKANGTVGLLPEEEAQVYARLDHEDDELEKGEADLYRAGSALTSLRLRHGGLSDARLEYFTVLERDALLERLSDNLSGLRRVAVLELNESGACRGVLHGARTVDEMIRYMVEEGEHSSLQQTLNDLPIRHKSALEPHP